MQDPFPHDASRASMMTPAHTLVDWSSVDTIDDVTWALIGDISHWELPEFKGKDYFWVEREILLSVHQHEWHKARPYGKPMWEHLCAFIKLKTPETVDILPELYNLVQAFCIATGTGGKAITLIGAQSTSKTIGICHLMDAVMSLFADKSMCFVGCAYNNISDTGAWGDLKDISKETHSVHPEVHNGFKAYAEREIVYDSNGGKFGVALARTPSDASKYKGIKQHRSEKGFILLFNEEINEHQSNAYLNNEENATSNSNFIQLNAFNWRSSEDLGAEVTTPDPTRGGIKNHSDVDLNNGMFFDAIGENLVLRNDGIRSANMMAGKQLVSYNYFGQRNYDFLIKRYGEEHPVFLSQARAYPGSAGDADTILDMKTVQNSRYNDSFTIAKEVGRTAFADFAFGGKDSSIYSWATTYDIYYTDGDDVKRSARVCVWSDYLKKLKLVSGALWNEFWFDRAEKCGCNTSEYKKGTPVTYPAQLVIQCAELNTQNRVPKQNYGYDFSMNDELVTEHNKLMGFGPISMNYNKAPLGVNVPHRKENTKDFCTNRRDELFFLATGAFHGHLIRGGKYIQESCINDLCKHRVEPKGKKMKVESNKEFKSRNRGRSPDALTAFIGNVEIARMKTGVGQKVMGDKKSRASLFKKINQNNKPRRW